MIQRRFIARQNASQKGSTNFCLPAASAGKSLLDIKATSKDHKGHFVVLSVKENMKKRSRSSEYVNNAGNLLLFISQRLEEQMQPVGFAQGRVTINH
jgi:hypothetical protein